MKTIKKKLWAKLVLVILFVCVGIIAAKVATREKNPFALAEDFPRGALVYAQFADLPMLVKRWDESKLKSKYLESKNFSELQDRHLTLKLLDRWNDFNTALGFTLDANSLSGASDNKCAIALYDVGRLDAVFIAPVSSEKIASTIFHQNKDKFEETVLADGMTYYSLSFEVDRGRMKQKFLFAASNGRFVLATSEPLLMRALSNINGKNKKDRLADEPSFGALGKLVSPHDATLWVDQSRLNQDLYFKHYWLMSKTESLAHIRAAMFDLEMKDDKWIERREFLSAKEANRAIPYSEVERLRSMMPADAPFLKLKTFSSEENSAAVLINNTLFDRLAEKSSRKEKSWDVYDELNYGNDYYDSEYAYRYYSYLGEEFDETIDDVDEMGEMKGNEAKEARLKNEAALQSSIQKAQPLYSIAVTKPLALKEPFFAEFNRGAALTLQKPSQFDALGFEQATAGLVGARVLVRGAKVNLKWTSAQDNNLSWRELELPMLGWKFCYKLENKDLIVTNNAELMSDILSTKKDAKVNESKSKRESVSLESLTVIRLDQRAKAFDEIVRRVDDENSKAFFSGNIGSLLDVLSDVSRAEIRRNSTARGFHEEVEITLVQSQR